MVPEHEPAGGRCTVDPKTRGGRQEPAGDGLVERGRGRAGSGREREGGQQEREELSTGRGPRGEACTKARVDHVLGLLGGGEKVIHPGGAGGVPTPTRCRQRRVRRRGASDTRSSSRPERGRLILTRGSQSGFCSGGVVFFCPNATALPLTLDAIRGAGAEGKSRNEGRAQEGRRCVSEPGANVSRSRGGPRHASSRAAPAGDGGDPSVLQPVPPLPGVPVE